MLPGYQVEPLMRAYDCGDHCHHNPEGLNLICVVYGERLVIWTTNMDQGCFLENGNRWDRVFR